MQIRKPLPIRVWLLRLAWFAALWLAGVAVVGALALILRRVLL